MGRYIKQIAAAVIVILLVTIIASACNKNKSTTKDSAVTEKTVEIMKLATTKQQINSELSGNLMPLEEVTASFETGGRITSLPLKEGEYVQAGSVIAQIDDEDYMLQVENARALSSQARAGLEQVENGATEHEKIQAQAMLDKARTSYDKAKADYDRANSLHQASAISQSDYEKAQTVMIAAQKDLENAEQAHATVIEGPRSEIKAQTRAAYQQSVVGQEKASLLLEKTRLKAPISGTIISKLSTLGQLISAGTPVYKIGAIDKLKVVLPVSDREISQWQVGKLVTLNLYGQKREGTVKYIYPATEQNTGTIGTEVWVENPDHNWFAGQVVKATSTLKEKEAVWAPIDAVVSAGTGKPYVFLYQNKKAVKRTVTVGELVNDHLEITSGVKAGDVIIASGADRLFDGDPVTPLGGE
jgi:multidrug efflux pump subunit AcrA (membrane-fusion protein)